MVIASLISILADMIKSIRSRYELEDAYRQGEAVALGISLPDVMSPSSFIHLGFELDRRQ
jgi:hypothetical protein